VPRSTYLACEEVYARVIDDEELLDVHVRLHQERAGGRHLAHHGKRSDGCQDAFLFKDEKLCDSCSVVLRVCCRVVFPNVYILSIKREK
jgi:hypothetical protein